MARITLGVALALAASGGFLVADSWTVSGQRATGARLEHMRASPRFDGARFEDVLPRQQASMLRMSREYFFGGSKHRTPASPVSVQTRTRGEFAALPDALRVTWLGHSTLLVELDGRRVLLDPVWGDRASPFTWAGPQRFYPPPLPLAELPPIDAVLISHDHYDHLDWPTVVALGRQTDAPFLVPLGVGAHLEYWGIAPERIVELDWWQSHSLGGLTFVATPARHFSGRSVTFSDRDATLWAGWALIGPRHRVYYSGDTAMFAGFEQIGERLGPFDVTLIECGAYSALWADVHLGPEQAVLAHQRVRGHWLIPVHWGLFDLALHGWTEPIERVAAAARAAGVKLATPRPGQSFAFDPDTASGERWWPEVTWTGAAEAPVVSSHLAVRGVAPSAGTSLMAVPGDQR
jgi:L-ascorbate metabolism protein UlaG (beta-lactamase superfamily)